MVMFLAIHQGNRTKRQDCYAQPVRLTEAFTSQGVERDCPGCFTRYVREQGLSRVMLISRSYRLVRARLAFG